ncbi:MAG TPA: bifunctional tRNA (5-methylaminomethyl-2-thiouridine)(34)-methyltransferase MnmD/FAD-dependent 5-carboxymethylaminomethyl-2-thiouridine(34) oxidoreductase MnmC [Casimicrobiaceae bacterium]|nr:bifunctional tRNA (5-methylaminomethyl-2-thiouridine)(34)-methyltransferase MnmD/FAD-dependent 5-carboxymethylaminomethyl-2-thiouridine(34) oxidoreductase MnmC [Casimicrobiaceae bacterium]
MRAERPARRVVPATLAFDASGNPFSPHFSDVYHSADSAAGQARHVFLHGNDLPARWGGARVFTIVETGFGIGLNFLATWQAWRDDPHRCARLHFVSIERWPFARADLATLHARYPEWAALSSQLVATWPPLVPGMHRLHFDDERVTLTLAFDEAIEATRALRLAADAFYLDGFAPDRNPAMWSAPLLKALARLAAPGATAATYSAAGAVRDGLAAAGFAVEKRAGFGRKRDMLAARYAPRWPVQRPRVPPSWPERHAIVIGAGLSGAAVASRLAVRGWRIDVVECGNAPSGGASGLRAGVFQPHISRDDNLLSRFTRAGFLYALRAWSGVLDAGAAPPWRCCGVLQLADGSENESRVADTALALAYPVDYGLHATRTDASALAGRPTAIGGWWFPTAGFVRPSAIVEAQLGHAARHAGAGPAAIVHLDRRVASLQREGDRWAARDSAGATIAAAPVVVLANASDAVRLVDPGGDPWRRIRGQQSYVPTPPFAAPRVVVGGDGYVLPAVDGYSVAGATYDLDDDDPRPNAVSHAINLARAERMLPGCAVGVDAATLAGGVGFRCVATDRLPMVGAIADIDRARAAQAALAGAHLADLPRVHGLYGAFAFASRGLSWSALAAEALASELAAEPAPLSHALLDAIDPGRFVVKALRRGAL